jgi:ketosteroid isomerase-like protein
LRTAEPDEPDFRRSLMYRTSSLGISDSTALREMESTIRAMTQDFCIAFNTSNYDQAAALFTAEAVFMPPHQESFQGTKAIERALREFGSSGYESLRFETTWVDGSGDMAFEIGRYEVNVRKETAILADRGKYLRGWRRLGAWRIIADCWSSCIRLGDDARLTGVKIA